MSDADDINLAPTAQHRFSPLIHQGRARTRAYFSAAVLGLLLGSARLPAPTQDVRRCKGCSLRDRCQAEALVRLQTANFIGNPFDPEA